jgi:hypothetical protein
MGESYESMAVPRDVLPKPRLARLCKLPVDLLYIGLNIADFAFTVTEFVLG